MSFTKNFLKKVVFIIILASDVGYTKNTKQKLQLFIPNEEIKAFSANVNLIVKFAKYQSVVSLYYENETVPLSSQFVTFTKDKTLLIFDCGYFVRVGNYTFKYYENSKTGLPQDTISFEVKTPDVKLTFQSDEVLFMSDNQVSLEIDDSTNSCKSPLLKSYTSQLSVIENKTKISTIFNKSFPILSPIIVDCDVIKETGEYKAVLQVDINNSTGIFATSNSVHFHRSNVYDMSLKSDSSLSCSNNDKIEVNVVNPPCSPTDEKIDLIVVKDSSNKVLQQSLNIQNSKTLFFNCLDLEDMDYPIACFVYKTADDFVLRKKCYKTATNKNTNQHHYVNGGWSLWSSWATCNRTGSDATMRRKRKCDNPLPIGRNSLKCSGKQGEYEILNLGNETTKNKQTCECGCYLFDEDGLIVSPLAGQCMDYKKIMWEVMAPPNHLVKFLVTSYELTYGEYVTIDDMKLPSQLQSGYQVATGNSTSQVAYVRDAGSLRSCGFVLKYEFVERTRTATVLTTVQTTSEQQPIKFEHFNFSLLISVLACSLVVVVTLLIACVKLCRKRKSKANKKILPNGQQRELIEPPDGKSSSDVNENAEVKNVQFVEGQSSSAHQSAVYYLAQQQLKLMKKVGEKEGACQTYEQSCLLIPNLRDQQDLLFGEIPNTKLS